MIAERTLEFWSYLVERELIRQRRLIGLPREQWTHDKIMQEYSFTNVKREHDRTTMLLRAEFYDPRHQRLRAESAERVGIEPQPESKFHCHPDPEAFLNAIIFRYTGTIECARALGWTTEWDRKRFESIVGSRVAVGQTAFTSAYIVPNCGLSLPKHQVVGQVIDRLVGDQDSILMTDSWAVMCMRMSSHFGVGDFMAKEVILDYVLATGWRPSDWETWTPVGPGARRGVSYILTGRPDYKVSEGETLRVIREIYATREQHWPKTREGFTFPELELTDIQFAMCELAKYQKVRLDVGRPKRKFRPTIDDVTQAVTKIDSSLVDAWVDAAPALKAAYDADSRTLKERFNAHLEGTGITFDDEQRPLKLDHVSVQEVGDNEYTRLRDIALDRPDRPVIDANQGCEKGDDE